MYPHRDYYRNESTIRSLPIAIKSASNNSWTSVLLDDNPSATDDRPKEYTASAYPCVPREPKHRTKLSVLREQCQVLFCSKLLMRLFHVTNILHYVLVPYILVFWHTVPSTFYLAYYLGVHNDVVYIIYATALCRARGRLGEWLYNLFLVLPYWLLYEEVAKRADRTWSLNGFNVGFFIARCATAPLRLYWSLRPLAIVAVGEFSALKFVGRLALCMFLLLHGGGVVWAVVVIACAPRYRRAWTENATHTYSARYAHCLHYTLDFAIENTQPGPAQAAPNWFTIGVSLACCAFALYLQGGMFLNRELHNKRLIKLQLFTNSMKAHLRRRRLAKMAAQVARNHRNVEVHQKAVALDECGLLLRAVNWPLVQEVLLDQYLPALRTGALLALRHPAAECYLRHLSTQMQREHYNEREVVFAAGADVDRMVVLVDGYVEVLAEDNATAMLTLGPGTCLGQMALLISLRCKAVVRCATHARALVLSRRRFLAATLRAFPELHRQLAAQLQAQLADARRRKRATMMRPPQRDVSVVERASKQLYKVCAVELRRTSRIGQVDQDRTLNAAWNGMMVVVGVVVAIAYPYFVAFERRFPAGFKLIALPMEALIVVDLALTLITYEAPRGKQQRVHAFSGRHCARHLWRKLSDWSFYLDFAAAIVLEPITYALPARGAGEAEQVEFLHHLLKLNRVLKVYKLFHLVWSVHFGSAFYKRLLIHGLTIALLTYYGAVALYLAACFRPACDPDGWYRTLQRSELAQGVARPRTDAPFLCALHASLLHVNSMDVHLGAAPLSALLALLLCLGGYVYLRFVFVDLASLSYLQLAPATLYRADMDDVQRLAAGRAPPALRRRLLRYYRLQWDDAPGHLPRYAFAQRDGGSYLTPALGSQVILAERLASLMKVPLLAAIGRPFCRRLALRSKVYVLDARDVVTYKGSMNKEMLVLAAGYCAEEGGAVIAPLDPPECGDGGGGRGRGAQTEPEAEAHWRASGELWARNAGALGMPSLLFNLPEQRTVTTATACLFISVDGAALQEALLHHPHLQRALAAVLRAAPYAEAARVAMDGPAASDPPPAQPPVLSRWRRLLRFFSAQRSIVHVPAFCRRRGERYADPFRREEIAMVKYLLVPLAVCPWGALFLGWVAVRALVALLLGVLTPTMLLAYGRRCGLHGSRALCALNAGCDLVLAADICLLAHLAFPTRAGVLVVHPYRTFGRYGGRGLLVDCCLALPVEWLYMATHDDARTFALLRLAKCAQVYKYFVILVKLRRLNLPMLRRAIELLKCVSWLALAINASASALIAAECEPAEVGNFTGMWLRCDAGSWLRRTPTWTAAARAWQGDALVPLGAVYTLGLYWSARLVFGVSFGDLSAQGGANALIVVLVLAAGLCLRAYCLKCVLAYFLATLEQHQLATRVRDYQAMMHNLAAFLAGEREFVDEQQARKLRANAVYHWRMTEGVDTNQLLSRLHTTLLQDTLCSSYEAALRQVPLFASMERAFQRILVLIAAPARFLPQQVIVEQEDVCDRFYVILEGVVHVELARSSYRVNIARGSIFGYFSKDTTPVMSIRATSTEHVHVLCFKSADYFNILQNYARFDVEVKGVLSEYKDFMPNHAEQPPSAMLPPPEVDGVASSPRRGVLRSVRFYKVMDEVFRACAFANAMLLPLHVVVEHWSLLYIAAAVDGIFLLAFALDFLKPYYNAAGILVTDPVLSRRRSVAGRLKYLRLFELACIVTIALSYGVYCIPMLPAGLGRRLDVPSTLVAYLRLAALYRCRYIGRHSFWDIEDDLFYPRLAHILMSTLIVLQWSTCLWTLLHTHTAPAAPHDAAAVWAAYFRGLVLVTNLFTGGSTLRQAFPAQWEQLFIVAHLVALSLYRYYLLAKAISCLHLKLRPILTFNFQLQQLRAYLRTIRVDAYQVHNLVRHLVALQKRAAGENFPALLRLLPAPLVDEVKVLLYLPLLRDSYVFYGTQTAFLRNVAKHVRRALYLHGEVVAHRGDVGKCMYFIRAGSVQIVSVDASGVEVAHERLQAGEMFGLAQGLFRHRAQQPFTFRALGDAEILTLRLDRWEHLLRHFPASKEAIYSRIRGAQR